MCLFIYEGAERILVAALFSIQQPLFNERVNLVIWHCIRALMLPDELLLFFFNGDTVYEAKWDASFEHGAPPPLFPWND